MSVSCKTVEIEITTEQAVLTETQEDGLYYIQSVFRRDRKVRRGEPDGNLMKALCGGGTEINVTFTGTDPDDPTTVFHVENSQDKKADALRYRSGDDNYYLAVEEAGQVKFCKLDRFPSEDKYFFQFKRVRDGYEALVTIRSKITEELYLHCGEDGNVFTKKLKIPANEVPEDRQTWFRRIRNNKIQEHVFQSIEECTLQAANANYMERDTVTIDEAWEDTEDSGKGISAKKLETGTSQDSIKANSEAPYVGNSKDPEKENCNTPGRWKSEEPGQVIPEDLKELNSEESAKANSEDQDVENSEDPAETSE